MDEGNLQAGVAQSSSARLHNCWTEFVRRFEWHWFCTMTFRNRIHPEAADKRFRLFVSKLNRKLFGPRWHRKRAETIYWVRGLEYQKRDVIHFHALLGCRGKDLNHHAIRRYWSDTWNELAGFARIEVVRSGADAARYITKYVTKGGEIDLSPNIQVGRILGPEDDSGLSLAAPPAQSA